MTLLSVEDLEVIEPSPQRDLTAYVAGPMSGYPERNYPAFDEAERYLRARGWRVFSPAEMDRADEANPATVPFAEAMRRDYVALTRSGALFLLRGWGGSDGARAELACALVLRLRIYEFVYDGGEVVGWRRVFSREECP